MPGLRTKRLLLRPWHSEDREPFAAMNADPRVMEYFPSTLTRAQSDAGANSIEAHFTGHSFGLWAVEIPGLTSFAGFVGLAVPGFETAFTPCVEVGWRLGAKYWGRGFATEAARSALSFGYETLRLSEIVSFTAPMNTRSIRVMERVEMIRDPLGDFDHPRIPEGHPLRRQVLYRAIARRA